MQDLSNAKVGDELVPYFEKTLIQKSKLISFQALPNIESEIYHKEKKGVSASTIKNCITPVAYKMHLDNPKKFNKVNGIVGTALHCLLLEPNKFNYRCFDEQKILNKVKELRPEIKNLRSTKEYKDLMQKYKCEDGEFLDDVLSLDAYNSMFVVKGRVKENPIISNLLTCGIPELSIMATYDNGLNVKIRPDYLKEANDIDAVNLKEYGVKKGDIINISVKTSVDGSPFDFYRACIKLGYDIAEAFYQDVLQGVYPGKKIHTFYLMCEKDADNIFNGNILLYHNSEKHISIGRRKYKDNLDVYFHCLTTGDYSMGYEFFNNGSILMEI